MTVRGELIVGDIIGETVVKAADMKHAAHYDTAKVYIVLSGHVYYTFRINF